VPREDADELRDADPENCPVCDALPHRRNLNRIDGLFGPELKISEPHSEELD